MCVATPRLASLRLTLRVFLVWIESSVAQRKAHVEVLLESLEHRDAEIRFTNARRLLYVLQGASVPLSLRFAIDMRYKARLPKQRRRNTSYTGYLRIVKLFGRPMA